MMLSFTVRVKDEWLTVPCKDLSYNIQWLGREALRRYTKAKADDGGLGCVEDMTFLVKRCQGPSLLDPNDAIGDVLQDKDFIQIVIQGQEAELDPLNTNFASLYPFFWIYLIQIVNNCVHVALVLTPFSKVNFQVEMSKILPR
ncbi:histidine ammonia-lyase-like [Leucoraja erinacea]|uniref:histidine ammonia-lyase-like n=1 Tax=Leucoraja erinaceus TaxID=7782 RepID=UPI002454223E|nr:histidine ammonia-lyase-like [Leucoraja erinacea]